MRTSFKLTALATLVLSGTALAQENTANTEEVGEVTVTAQSGSAIMGNKKAYTTSAMKTTTGLALSPKETPQSVSVITQTQLEDRGISSMQEAMRTTTGVNVVADSGKVRFQSRGFYINRIEEDGIATTVTGGTDGNIYRDSQSSTDLAIYDHIEVVRGATGLTQGVGEPGGTINAVRKKPTSEFQAFGNVLFNTHGKARTMADVSGSLTPSQSVRGRFVAVGEYDPTFQNLDNDNRLIYGVLDADLGDSTVLTVGGTYQNQHRMPDHYGVPVNTDGGDLGWDRDTYLGYQWQSLNTRKLNLFAETDTFIGENWQWSNKVSYTRNNSVNEVGAIANTGTSYAGYTNNSGATIATNNLLRYDNSGEQLALKTGGTGKYHLFGREHDLFANYTYTYEQGDTRYRRIRNSTAYNPQTFSGTEIAYPNWENYADQIFYNNRIINHGIMLGSRFNILDNLHFIGGTRYTNWRNISETDYNWWNGRADSDADIHTTTKRSRFIPYAGLTYDINENQSLYASYTSIFSPQTNKNIEGKTLDPIIGTNYELGWKTQWNDGKLNTAVALFDITQKNRPIAFTGVDSNAKSVTYYEPMGKIRSRGFDVEVSGNLTDDWLLFAGYTYNKSKYSSNESTRYTAGSNANPWTPKHILRMYTSYTLPFDAKKWTIGGGMNFQSRATSVYGVSQSSYATFDVNAKYQFNKHIDFSVAVTNLTDKRYFENNKVRVKGANNYYGEPRTFVFNLGWKF